MSVSLHFLRANSWISFQSFAFCVRIFFTSILYSFVFTFLLWNILCKVKSFNAQMLRSLLFYAKGMCTRLITLETRAPGRMEYQTGKTRKREQKKLHKVFKLQFEQLGLICLVLLQILFVLIKFVSAVLGVFHVLFIFRKLPFSK